MLQKALTVTVIMILLCSIWASRDCANRHTVAAGAGATTKSQLWANEKKLSIVLSVRI